ncbi:MAG: hypothetical protein OEO71_06350 [Gammaproteobacteria bacterium]|nr:hypothetical protein [Gammaproteobacteria bacterium]
MLQRLTHFSLVLVLLLSSEVWAIGLGDIRLDSALNEPLRAEISLLSATPDELAALNVAMASAATFTRYGIDRPFYLQEIEFNVVGGANGSAVQLRSRKPMTEPFLTFLVEVNWPGGRLLREYTVLLDPPTYAPPAAKQAPAVSAPSRTAPADSGRIERQQPAAPRPQPAPPARPTRPSPPASSVPADDTPYDTSSGGDYVVKRSETLWGIASRMRPDRRLTMNQTMLAIFEANPGAFGGNINLLRAGAALRIPSADEIFRISRDDALAEARRQNEAWGSGTGYTAPPVETRPSLTLVPPDEEPTGLVYDDDLVTAEPLTREQEIENRINELETADVPDQPSLLEIRDNELATLRQELANIRGEVYEPPADVTDGPFVDDIADETPVDELFAEEDELATDTEVADDETVADEDVAETEAPSTVVRTAPKSEPGIVDRILEALTSYWAGIAAALVVVAGLLFWFMRRGRDEEDSLGAPWEALDSDELATGSLTSTESMHAPTPDEAIMVVEQDSAIRSQVDETVEMPVGDEADKDTGAFGSLEDTFSSETAVNLDQTDPVAEADFHMAYGLYDQAADLINGALEADPSDKGLMSKLCEIYFVWGNRDAFIDAARKLKSSVGDGESPEWDKTVIMGQQIASDHELFAGAGVAAATKAVDLSFEAETGEAALDMDFGGGDSAASDVIDLGADDVGAEGDVDFMFEADDDGLDIDLDVTAETPTIATTGTEKTLEMPTPDDTVESPTIEQEFGELEGTSELPSLDELPGQAISDAGQGADATAEINLDDLDLGIDGLAETELASLDDLDETGTNEALLEADFTDTGSVTGKNPEVDPNATGVREGLDPGMFDDLDATGEMRLATDETGRSPLLDPTEEFSADTEIGIDQSLLDATGVTQVLSEDMSVNTGADIGGLLSDEDATMLGSMDEGEDEGEFDFAKTEALPPDAFVAADVDATGDMPSATTDVDLDLDDLTAALKVSEVSDTIDQLANEATVEQPRPTDLGSTAEIPTMSLGPEDISEDLYEARTMTEVGTKLDLARAYVDMGDPAGARSILEEVLDEGDEGQRQQAQQLLDSLRS